MDDRLLKWFELASLAPSAANNQPWSYHGEIAGRDYHIFVKIHPEILTNPSTLDPYFATATIAIGCFIQNLEIAAHLEGFKCNVTEITGETAATWEWKLIFVSAPTTEINLLCTEATLRRRVSNRTLYDRTPIATSDLKTTQKFMNEFPHLSLSKIGSLRDEWINVLIKLESVRLNEDVLREELFQEFRTQSEIAADPVGLPINTVSNSFFQRALIFLMKKVPLFRLPLKYGAGPLFSWLSLSRPLFYSGDLFALQLTDRNPRTGVELGKTLEGLWLLWTELGYSVQVIALPILIYGNKNGLLGQRISSAGNKDLCSVQSTAQQNLKMDLTLMTVLMRVGYSTESTPQSPRRRIVL